MWLQRHKLGLYNWKSNDKELGRGRSRGQLNRQDWVLRLLQPWKQHQGQLHCFGPVVATVTLVNLSVSSFVNLFGLFDARMTD